MEYNVRQYHGLWATILDAQSTKYEFNIFQISRLVPTSQIRQGNNLNIDVKSFIPFYTQNRLEAAGIERICCWASLRHFGPCQLTAKKRSEFYPSQTPETSKIYENLWICGFQMVLVGSFKRWPNCTHTIAPTVRPHPCNVHTRPIVEETAFLHQKMSTVAVGPLSL